MRKIICIFLVAAMLTGCATQIEKEDKEKQADFTVVKKEDIPMELSGEMEARQEAGFELTFTDQGYLYLAKGYGVQETGGCSVVVEDCYETANALVVKTNLLGPETKEEATPAKTYPCVVIKLEECDKQVVFQ